MKVLESYVSDSGETWFRVELERSTDILEKELFTRTDVRLMNDTAIMQFLNWQGQQYFNWKPNG